MKYLVYATILLICGIGFSLMVEGFTEIKPQYIAKNYVFATDATQDINNYTAQGWQIDKVIEVNLETPGTELEKELIIIYKK